MVLEPLSNVDAAERDFPRAVRLWAAAQAIKERVGGGAPSEMMQTVDPSPAAVEAIGEQAVSEAWAAGQAMSPADAVAYAIGAIGLRRPTRRRRQHRSGGDYDPSGICHVIPSLTPTTARSMPTS